MIRRDLADSNGNFWVLIPQQAHAALSGELAAGWGASLPGDTGPRGDELLSAITHHDDGWATWDAAPGVDDAGKPSNFNEMLLGESLAIWRHSIAACQQYGPLAAYAVAGHFCALLERFDSWKSSPTKQRLAEKFLAYYDQQMANWLLAWRASDQADRFSITPEAAIAWLQFFDALSLWFCTAKRATPESFTPPGESAFVVTPLSSDRIAVDPWPWREPTRNVRIAGRKVPSESYTDAKSLAAAAFVDVELSWQLEPKLHCF